MAKSHRTPSSPSQAPQQATPDTGQATSTPNVPALRSDNSARQGLVGSEGSGESVAIMRKASAAFGADTGAAMESASQSSGHSLDAGVQSSMEASFGQSFGDVSVHTDSAAASAADSANAKAFTTGNDVYFGAGQYNPGSSSGQHLIAHELAHVAQGAGGAASASGEGPSVSRPGDAGERAADVAADKAVRGEPVGDVGTAPATVLHREGVEEDDNEDPLAQLREEADDFFVDEVECLRIIRGLNPTQKGTVRGDTTLMNNLAGAFDSDEMLRAVNDLGFDLKWKIYWLDKAGVLSDVGSAQIQLLIVRAQTTPQQILELIGWPDMWIKTLLAAGTWNPIVLFEPLKLTPIWPQILATSTGIWPNIIIGATAQEMLKEIANPAFGDPQVTAIIAKMQSVGAWAIMKAALPKGSALQPADRTALRRLAGLVDATQGGSLFEIRFNLTLAAATGVTFAKEDILGIWDQMAVLPDQDVSDNTFLNVVRAISGDRGFANSDHSIELGTGLRTNPDPDRLGHTVRHEVGHRVHAALASTVDSWLQKEIGFWYTGGGSVGADFIVNDLGGWPSTFKDKSNRDVPFTAADQTRMKTIIANHSGSSTWGPNGSNPLPSSGSVARDDTLPAGSAMTQAERDVFLWEALNGKVHNLFTQSDTGPWYANYNSHSTGPKGRYFWNHWYAKPYYFSSTAKTAIDATGDNYSAMSEAEFFANCYAEYFEDPAGYNDNTKWGGSLNAPVKNFFTRHILERQPYTPPASGGGSTPSAPAQEGDTSKASGTGGAS